MSPPPEPGLSSRVWLDAAMTQIGLAMARSIGDHAVKSIGVVAEPEVTTHTIEVRGDCRRHGSGVGCDQVRFAVRGWLGLLVELFYGRSKPHTSPPSVFASGWGRRANNPPRFPVKQN